MKIIFVLLLVLIVAGTASATLRDAALAQEPAGSNFGGIPTSPQDVTLSPFQPAVGVGGRAVAATVDPTDTSVAVVASESGGLFQTVDGGTHWFHLDNLPMFRLLDVKYAPISPVGQKVIIVTGHGDSSTINNGGIWVSTDNGVTWQKPAGSNPPASTTCSARAAANGIAFAPDGAHVYVGTDCGLASSDDWGATWQHTVPNSSNVPVFSLAAQANGLLDICTSTGHIRRASSGAPFGPEDPGSPGCKSAHALAISPLEPNVVFIADDAPLPGGCVGRATAVFEGDYGAGSPITWSQVIRSRCLDAGGGIAGRQPIAATITSHDRVAGHFDLYFGDAANLWRQTCTGRVSDSGPRCSKNSWESVILGLHADQNGIAFSSSAPCPAYVLTDGGIFRGVDQTSPLCGRIFRYAGNGLLGYNALQIYDVTGQTLDTHQDLYFGTQDNGLWASSDGGSTWPILAGNEGGALQVPPRATDDAGQTIAWWQADGTGNYRGDAHFASPRAWTNPPGIVSGNPVVIAPGIYLQITEPIIGTYQLDVTRDTGTTWDAVVSVPSEALRLPQVSRVGNDLTVYQAYRKPGTTAGGEDQAGLLRITGLTTGGVVTGTPRAMTFDTDTLSVGSYPMGEGTFGYPYVWAVDPQNPGHLLVADVVSQKMKYTLDGGATWLEDTTLTDLLTQYDSVTGQRIRRFHIPRFEHGFASPCGWTLAPTGLCPEVSPGAVLQPHVVGFDPYNRNHILVGSEAVGIIRSTDGGVNWSVIPGSQAVTGVTAFYFIQNSLADPDTTVIVSTYGRGLWKLRFPPEPWPFLLPEEMHDPWIDGYIRGQSSGVIVTPEQLFNPDFCPNCGLAVLTNGVIQDMSLNVDGTIKGLTVTGGHLVGSDVAGKPQLVDIPLTGPVTPLTASAAWDGCPACAQIVKAGGLVRGVVTTNGKLLAVIGQPAGSKLVGEEAIIRFDAYPDPLPPGPSYVPPCCTPSLAVQTPRNLVDQTAFAGDTVALTGSGFSTDPACSGVTVTWLGQTVAKNVPIDGKGKFQTQFVVTGGYGRWPVEAKQTCPKSTVSASASVLLLIGDADEDHLVELGTYLPLITK